MTIAVRPGEQALEAFLDRLLGPHVDVRGRLVEDQDARLGEQRAGEGDQLALAGGQLHAALADLGLDPLRQGGDELGRADRRRGRFDLLEARLRGGRRRCSRERCRRRGSPPGGRSRAGRAGPAAAPCAGRGRRPRPCRAGGHRSGRRAWRRSTCRRRSRRPGPGSGRADVQVDVLQRPESSGWRIRCFLASSRPRSRRTRRRPCRSRP